MSSLDSSKNIFSALEETDSKTTDSIFPFEGKKVVPLVKHTDNEVTSKVKKTRRGGKKKRGGANKTKDKTKFVVSTSYSEQRDQELENQWKTVVESCDQTPLPLFTDPRSDAFVLLNDKISTRNRLLRTKICNNIQPNERGEFGVCFRKYCDFAHSLEELKDPMCLFDSNCRNLQGRINRDGSIQPNSQCSFRHGFETREEWLTRTGKTLPILPRTSENTRKPIVSTPENTRPLTNNPPQAPVKAPQAPQAQPVYQAPQTPQAQPVYQAPQTPQAQPVYQAPQPPQPVYQAPQQPQSQLLCSYVEPKRLDFNSTKVISVQSKELAEIAIKAAFDRGVYDIRVVIE
jgi:hypothetical protein